MNLYQEEGQNPPSEDSSAPRRSNGLGLVVLAVLVVALMGWGVLSGGGWLGGIRPSAEALVFRWEGQNSQEQSPEFAVGDSWELRWEHDGELREICWTNETGETECFASLHRKPIRRHGSVNVSHGGRFTLSVRGTATWKLEVFRLGEP